MRDRAVPCLLFLPASLLVGVVFAAAAGSAPRSAGAAVPVSLAVSLLGARGVDLDAATYRGRAAAHLTLQAEARDRSLQAGEIPEGIAVVAGTWLLDGTIEADVAGRPRAGASGSARGFVGLAFRVGAKPRTFDCFYIRPTNGRSDDQLRRNHATQYEAMPDFPWSRLRMEFPGVYESYADMEPGAWTHLRIEVGGGNARLHVNRASQPALVVGDLKNEPVAGAVALWIGDETEGWFSRLEVTPR